jgi:BirA family biotin operon repressor/biotin-[acetyl-CoA-carboxylase] ligase
MSKADILDQLIAEEMVLEVAGRFIGREIIVLESTTSTNDSILERAGTDTAEGLVIFAQHQTAGRGQRDNRWESPRGKGLWFSMLLRPRIPISESARLTTWAATSLASSIERITSRKTEVKAPNDVLLDGRKIAGVLVEMRARAKAPHLVIAGIGINVNQSLSDFSDGLRTRATSLALISGRAMDRQKFAIEVLRDLDRSYGERFA